MENYIAHTAPGGMHAINVFVEKPFIPVPPDSDGGENWVSGELFTYYRDWLLEECRETVFDCRSGGIGHKHCMDTVLRGSCLRTAGRRMVVSEIYFEKAEKKYLRITGKG